MTPSRKGLPLAWPTLALPLALLVGTASVGVAAEPAAVADAISEQATGDFQASYSATLKQLGARYPMSLRGVEGSDSVTFDVRADQVVTGARVKLEYSYSPALLSELSQLNVMVNDQVAVSLPLPKEDSGSLQSQVVDLPPHLITEFNRLTLQLIGHYTMQCEDPLHSSLWAKVNNSSELQLQTTPIALPNDLGLLPQPFFDVRDSRLLELPFVFAGNPDNSTLEAAGAVASWFGALASYRGVHFPVSLGDLPQQGHAVVLLVGDAAPRGISAAQVDGPSVAVVENPNDPFGKLLLISARDSQQLKDAAHALVTGSKALAGEQARIGRVESLQPRKPYDAPNWLPTDRPVRLGELIESSKLSVSGYNPGTISLPMRLPPDLFNWRKQGVPLKLAYRYTPQPESENSSLLISVSDKYVKSMPLLSQQALKDSSLLNRLGSDDSLLRETELRLPLESLPLQSTLQLRFMYDYIKQGECRDIIVDNMRGSIEPDSTIDLRGYEHFIALPNLGVFQSSGFPFTRLADLSETAVVLSDAASPEELSLYLDVLGRFGDSTGYPALAVTVAQADQQASLQGKDLLVLAAGDQQPLLQRWADRLPASLGGDARFELSDLVHRVRNWVAPGERSHLREARGVVELRSGSAPIYLAGFESPLDSGRSVVVLAAQGAEQLPKIAAALRGGEAYDNSIQGSLAVINGTQINSLVADEHYYVGKLGWFRYLQWQLSRNLAWMLLATAAAVLLISLLAFVSLRARARARLSD
jgi:hypothetical protein